MDADTYLWDSSKPGAACRAHARIHGLNTARAHLRPYPRALTVPDVHCHAV